MAGLIAVLFALSLHAQTYSENLPPRHPEIRYFESALDDPVTRLANEMESGRTSLSFRSGPMGYLPSLLEHLGVSVDSQSLVFSKTSFQSPKISPRNPRAIYFNDAVAVGYVPGGTVLEVVAVDPRQGVVFYTLDTQESETPRLSRREVCLQCHQGPATQGVPGILVGSVFPNAMGTPSAGGAIITDHRTPFEDRWGGWFLNYLHPSLGQRSRADSVAADPAEPDSLTPLRKDFDTTKYPSATSDQVALMTLEHQTQMVNLLTRLGWTARIAGHDSGTDSQVAAAVEAVVSYMLFADEPALREPIAGVSTFAKTFPQRGPRDRQGRSLRDFDLKNRLFRYPLSYMIYGAQFDALADGVREKVYHRLYDVLTGKDEGAKFAGISLEDRKAILEILQETKVNLPSWWHTSKPKILAADKRR